MQGNEADRSMAKAGLMEVVTKRLEARPRKPNLPNPITSATTYSITVWVAQNAKYRYSDKITSHSLENVGLTVKKR